MGEGVDGLQHALIAGHVDFIDGDGKNDGEGEAEEDAVRGDDQRIAQSRQELRLTHHELEVLEVIPGRCSDTGQLILLEGQLNAVHGDILKDDEVGQNGNQHQIDPAVIPHPVQRVLKTLFRRADDGFGAHSVYPSLKINESNHCSSALALPQVESAYNC